MINTNLNVINKYLDCDRTVVSKCIVLHLMIIPFKCTSHATHIRKVTTGYCNSIKIFKSKRQRYGFMAEILSSWTIDHFIYINRKTQTVLEALHSRSNTVTIKCGLLGASPLKLLKPDVSLDHSFATETERKCGSWHIICHTQEESTTE